MAYQDPYSWINQILGQQQTQTAPVNSAPAGSQYQYDLNQLLNANWTDNGWAHFTGTDGSPLAAMRVNGVGQTTGDGTDKQTSLGPLLGYNVFSDPGDFGGTGFGGSHESKMNGVKYDTIDPTGKYTGNGAFSGWTDAGFGDALGVGAILGMAGGAAAAGLGSGAGAGAGLAGGGSGAFLGEGAASGIGAWDAALSGAPAWSAGAAAGAAPGVFNPAVDSQLASSQLGITGTQAAADAAAAGIPSVAGQGGGLLSQLGSLGSSALGSLGSGSNLLGTAATVLGGAAGAQGGAGGAGGSGAGGSGQTLDPRMTPYLYDTPNGLMPLTQQALSDQYGRGQVMSEMAARQGQNLLSQPIAGNGYGQVKLNAPTTSTNPYLSSQADDIGRRTQEMLGQNNLAIQGNAVGAGGLGGSRQGVAQGLAAGKAADYLSGNLANLFGTQYNNDQNRALQQYGMDQSFYGNQRGQDLSGAQLGGGLMSQSQSLSFDPLSKASDIYRPYTGLNSAAGGGSGGGTNWQGIAGGLLGGAQLAKNTGWW